MTSDDVMARIKGFSAYDLADEDRAWCGTPDNSESPGALLLTAVRDAVVEHIESNPDASADELKDDVDAEGQVEVYTYAKWKQFLDLAAWQEEPESGPWPSNLDDAASVALYQIVNRLAYRLIDAWAEARDRA